MIYLVSENNNLFPSEYYQKMSLQESLDEISKWDKIQFDSEEDGKDAHINNLLSAQFGNDSADCRIVVDCTTEDITAYKNLLESKLLILQNAKFDLQFLYNYDIIPIKVYDTMIVEQLIYLGYPKGSVSYSLKSIAKRRLDIDIDKTVRGEIIWRGLDDQVVNYAAGDVMYLEKIMQSQIIDLKEYSLIKAASIENRFVPVIAYMEWCGIYLNEELWKKKMDEDNEQFNKYKKLLDKFVINNPLLSSFVFIDKQLNLFEEYDPTPKVTINWSSPDQVVKIANILGFDTKVSDKDTGEDKDSVMEKYLKGQKGINDEFIELYLGYQEYKKRKSSFGQGHLNAINPNTGRIHTVFRQLGATSGRMSCGSNQNNDDLAKIKGLPINPSTKQKSEGLGCSYPNIQQLPSDEPTRSAFTNQNPDTLICSADFSALESRLGADIYNESTMIDEYLHGSGDMHSLMAITFFSDQMRDGITTAEVKKEYPNLRKDAKAPEFQIQFGGSAFGLAANLNIPIEQAEKYVNNYYNRFKGIAEFRKKGEKFLKENGYILTCEYSGHKMFWSGWKDWFEVEKKLTKEFWDDYKMNHKGTGDEVCQMVRKHMAEFSKWTRLVLNGPTQASGIVIMKIAMRNFFEWILENNYFSKLKISALIHDEALIEFDKSIANAPEKLKECMENAAALICTKLPIPSVPETGDHWIH